MTLLLGPAAQVCLFERRQACIAHLHLSKHSQIKAHQQGLYEDNVAEHGRFAKD